MRISLSTVCLPHLEWRAVFAAAANAGYTAIELLAIQGWQHVDATRADAAALGGEAQRLGLKIIGLHAGALDGLTEQSIAATEAYVRSALGWRACWACRWSTSMAA